MSVKFTYDDQIRRCWDEMRDAWRGHEEILAEDPRSGPRGPTHPTHSLDDLLHRLRVVVRDVVDHIGMGRGPSAVAAPLYPAEWDRRGGCTWLDSQ